MELKVLKGLATELCQERHLREKYETNRAFKAAALFTYLKNQTSSGSISLASDSKADTYSEILGISRASFYNYIRYAEDIGLCVYQQKCRVIRLTSYEKICEKYLLNYELITINHEPDNNRLEYTLKALEYEEARQRMDKGLQSKVRNNPQVKAAFAVETACLGANQELTFTTPDLWQLQQYVFAAGGSETTYDTLFVPNPDLNRNLFTLARVRKMKSFISAQYERKQLAKLNLLYVVERNPVQCPYRTAPVESKVKGRARHRRRYYDTGNRVAVWQLPHSIMLNPTIFAAAENPRPADVV